MPDPDPPKPVDPGGARPPGLSIRYSLPLLISALAAAVIAVFAAAAYHRLQASAVEVAGERLAAVTADLASRLAASVPEYRAQAAAQAADPALAAFLRDPATADSAPALAALADTVSVLGRELRDLTGRRVLATRPELPGGVQPDDGLVSVLARAPGGAVGSLRSIGDTLTVPVSAPVMSGDSAVGYLVSWRRVVGTGQRQIEQLVGLNARLYVANESGDLWTDLSRPVAGPSLIPGTMDGLVEYSRPEGDRWLAAAADIAGAPWVVVMEFPRELVVADAQDMLRSLVLFGLLLMLLAAAATWVLAGRFTRPITELAHAAQALSAGDYDRRSTVARSDEVGTLGRAFNTMADNVSSAHAALEHKVAQLAIMEVKNREVSERLQHVLASSPDVIYELRLSAGGAAFTWVSGNVERLLGYSVEEVTARGWWSDHVHPDDRGPHVPPPHQFGPDREATREYRLRHRDGRYRWIRDRQRLDSEHAVVGAWSDVTEMRTLEEKFRQAQKLEAIGQLAGGIAHDFNNIVTVILGESDMALSTIPADSPIRESLDQVRTAGERAALLTRQLLTFSRKQITEKSVFSLSDVVRDVQDMLRRLISEHVDLQIRVADDLAPVSADRGQIEQVLLNLVINARDAMPDGGTIVIETHDVVLDAEYTRSHPGAGSGEFVALVVSDTGTGMSEEVRSHLFEPFFTTKGPGQGTGLGLATSYGIARQFGGHIGVYSEVGVGTTMKLYLPRASAGEEIPAVRPHEEPRRGTETILLVEDEAPVRAIVARMLKAQGYKVIIAGNGHDALALLRSTVDPIDLLLTDLVMPQMGGRELAERVRELRPRLRVLFTSGYTEDVIVQNRLLERDIVLLHKPFTRAALAAKVRETLDAPFAAA